MVSTLAKYLETLTTHTTGPYNNFTIQLVILLDKGPVYTLLGLIHLDDHDNIIKLFYYPS